MLINTKLMSYPGNWVRVWLLAFIGLTALALVSGKLTKSTEDIEE